jgi:DNA replication and repair protein RecF
LHVAQLRLTDFRNYESETAELSPTVNLIIGANAQGKTNLLEAVHCLGGLGSPRAPDSALVRDGAECAVLHGRVVRDERRIRVDLELRPGRGARALLNGAPLPGTRSLGEVVVTVFFGPDDLLVVKGSPEGRRRFIDDLVVKLRPARYALRREWERVLKQRNALLKTARRAEARGVNETLEVWDDAFCRAGAALTAARLASLALLAPYVAKRYEAVAGGGRLELSYASEWLEPAPSDGALQRLGAIDEASIQGALANRVRELRVREIERGMSLIGPQRDDLVVRLASGGGSGPLLDARVYASQGDQRTSALALKLAEHDLLTETLGMSPVLLLDDVFSELDGARRRWLADTVRDMGQTVFTSAEPGTLEGTDPDRIIAVRAGRLEAHG